MGIFSVYDNAVTSRAASKDVRSGSEKKLDQSSEAGPAKIKRHTPPAFSKEEVRAKVLEKDKDNVSLSQAAIKKSQQRLDEKAVDSGKEVLPNNPIQDNSPDNSDVHHKLRGALSSGAINFSPSEKEVLAKILKQ